MKKLIAIASAVVAAVTIIAAPAASYAKVAKAKTAAVSPSTKYECSKCHMQFSAAEAKKDKYACTMDGGKLVAMKAAPAKAAPKMKM